MQTGRRDKQVADLRISKQEAEWEHEVLLRTILSIVQSGSHNELMRRFSAKHLAIHHEGVGDPVSNQHLANVCNE